MEITMSSEHLEISVDSEVWPEVASCEACGVPLFADEGSDICAACAWNGGIDDDLRPV